MNSNFIFYSLESFSNLYFDNGRSIALNLEKIVAKPRELKKIQAILFALRDKMTAKEIANLICIHTRTVKEYWARYRKEGKSFILEEKRGSGKGKKYLTSSEEEEFLKPFLDKAKVAGILTVSVIHKALEEKLGHKVHDSMVYKMLHRHNWRRDPNKNCVWLKLNN